MGERADPTGQCPHCSRPVFAGAKTCKARLCPNYASIWARDQQRKCFENLGSYDEGDGTAVMFTATAPGADLLPWDEDHCAALGEHQHSGLIGCRVRSDVAREWNSTCSDRWRRLHDRAARLTTRDTGHRPHMLLRAFEQQARGVLHVHATLARGRFIDKRSADVYGAHLTRLAASYGFGKVDTPTGRARPARESAAYLSAYLSGGKGHKRQLSETVRSDQLPRSIIHVSTQLTMRTHVTMRALRFRRLLNRRWAVNLPFDEQHNVQLLVEAFPGCELVPYWDDLAPPSAAGEVNTNG